MAVFNARLVLKLNTCRNQNYILYTLYIYTAKTYSRIYLTAENFHTANTAVVYLCVLIQHSRIQHSKTTANY